ncbi:MAG TPA: lipocalin family protein [Rhodanobacter sp.]|jgi:apolipoprotein D and lipocalin family protein|nr:lipocalin family protein [Rhodanobacter sp.]
MIRSLLMAALMAIVSLPIATGATLPNQPVRTLDLDRYTGQWHEIAHLPMYFQRSCLDAVIATYTANPDGTIHVHNTCRTSEGITSVDGLAKIAPGQPAALKVRFAPAWLSWLPQAWADYWVIEVDADYRWAVVGSPSRKYLWILSRDNEMPRGLFDSLKQRAQQRGYAVDKLVMMAPLD